MINSERPFPCTAGEGDKLPIERMPSVVEVWPIIGRCFGLLLLLLGYDVLCNE